MEVARVLWPDEADKRLALRSAGVPRLLLVTGEAGPPEVDDPIEDWVWRSAPDQEVQARARTLLVRALGSERPAVDADGVLRFEGRWATVPPVEARLCRALVDRFGTVVQRDELAEAGWPAGPPGRNALDVHMLRLRRRVLPLGLTIRTVRSRGYMLERSALGEAAGHAR
jgi:DNA-binding response OmpR family regulator